MIVPDTSVWIAHIRNQPIPQVNKLRDPLVRERVLVGDIVLTEVLQGARNEKDAARLEADFQKFTVVAMVGEILARKAAHNYRFMRQYGVTMKLPDLYICTFCVEHGYELLHNDSDFDAPEKLLGLRVLR